MIVTPNAQPQFGLAALRLITCEWGISIRFWAVSLMASNGFCSIGRPELGASQGVGRSDAMLVGVLDTL